MCVPESSPREMNGASRVGDRGRAPSAALEPADAAPDRAAGPTTTKSLCITVRRLRALAGGHQLLLGGRRVREHDVGLAPRAHLDRLAAADRDVLTVAAGLLLEGGDSTSSRPGVLRARRRGEDHRARSRRWPPPPSATAAGERRASARRGETVSICTASERRIVRSPLMPRYRDIAERVLERVATRRARAGRDAAERPRLRPPSCGTTPATVGRAYAELARLGVIDGAPRRAARVARDGATLARRALHGGARLRLAGSDDPLLDRIAGDAERVGARGSFGGLAALWQRRADAATLHLRHRDGRYNDPLRRGRARRARSGPRPSLAPRAGHRPARRQPRAGSRASPTSRPLGRAARPGDGTRVLAGATAARGGGATGRVRGPERRDPPRGGARRRHRTRRRRRRPARRRRRRSGSTSSRSRGSRTSSRCPRSALGLAADLLAALGSAPALPGFDLAGAGEVRRISR